MSEMICRSVRQRASNLLLSGAAVATLAVSPWYNFDPINPVKQLVIATVGLGLLGLLLNQMFKPKRNLIHILLLTYLSSMLIPLVIADAPLQQQIWGTFGRNNGFLSYFSSGLITLAAFLIANRDVNAKYVKYAIGTSALISAYAVLQVFSKDPIRWSAQNVFATLGNVNFLSAFLGFQTVLVLAVALFSEHSKLVRLSFASFIILNFLLIVKTDSVQGIVVLLAGSYLLILFWLLGGSGLARKVIPTVCWILFGLFGFFFGIEGLMGSGPAKSLLYQSTTFFRADYMGAAWRTFINHPISGVGFDSFDNWYRFERGFISAYRTNPGRTTNSAHNVFLDIAANGGLIMFSCYLLLVLTTIVVGLKALIKNKFDYKFAGLFASWCAFIIQSAISINQIGISVWGWISTGLILGISQKVNYSQHEPQSESKTDKNKGSGKVKKNSRMYSPVPAATALSAMVFAGVGAFVAFLPMQVDSQFIQGRKSGNLNTMIAASNKFAASSFLASISVDAASKANYPEVAIQLSDSLTRRFPREFYGWQFRMTQQNLTTEQRQRAYEKVKELDPYFACGELEASKVIRRWFDFLPLEKKYELARWWGFFPFDATAMPKGDWLTPISTKLDEHMTSYCGA